jgi:hypothetical protein
MTLFALLTCLAAIGPIVWLLRAPMTGTREWLTGGAAAAAISGSALLVGPWALLSVYLRPFVALILIGALAAARVRAGRRFTDPNRDAAPPRRLLWQAGTACVFALVFIDAVLGQLPPAGAADLRFPLEGGVYAVIQGGNSLVTNPFHHWFRSDKHGLDLVKLNAAGNRGRGLAPARLAEYASFNVPVHSPCTGTVEERRDDLPDHAPGAADTDNLSGNHVLLRCGDLRVLLAHLARGSVAVSRGDAVRGGQIVGRIGNSGNTNEPHLHIGAMTASSGATWPDAEAVPLTFGGRFLAINDVVR